MACRASATTASVRASAAVSRPRLASPAAIVAATASATGCGTSDPPGPSNRATPSASAGNICRKALMS